MFYNHLKSHIEALLFASGDPLSVEKLAQILDIETQHVEMLVAQLREEMEDDSRGLTIVTVAGGYQLCTKPQLSAVVSKLVKVQENKLSMAAMETLAIIAFKQPVTRQEIEAIRGVSVERVLTTLLERQVIKEVGRKEAMGRPILYGTTDAFLTCFGLKDLEDLPKFSNILPEKQPE